MPVSPCCCSPSRCPRRRGARRSSTATAISRWKIGRTPTVSTRRSWHGNQITLTNRTARLVVEKDSRTAQFNGVNVALSFPVAVDKGQFRLSHNWI